MLPMNSASSSQTRAGVSHAKQIAWWLTICAAMVFAMVMLGGATRLTESGLSMVEWKPLTVTPPMGDAAWQAEFQNYQQSPQFEQKNSWMTVDDFKGIYWLEYLHRLWGRVIGMAFLLPFLWFLAKRAIDKPLAWKLAGLFFLGGAQGALGWFMVASGLESQPAVSQYRLAAHLFTALLLYAALIWTALDLFRARHYEDRAQAGNAPLARLALALACAVVFVMVSGAFVAGLRAGLAYNTFPLMDGHLIPPGVLIIEPWYLNLFENATTVQFDHRVLAITLLLVIAGGWMWARRLRLTRRARRLVHAVMAMALLQVSLGISTLLLVVPMPLALAHQTGALILFTLALCLAHTVRAPAREPGYAQVPLHVKPAE